MSKKSDFVNHYKVLGLKYSKNAKLDEKTIKKAYRKLALKCHPDRNKGPDAQAKFIAITRSFDALCDKKARAKLDKTMKGRYANDVRKQKRSREVRGMREVLERREREACKKQRAASPAAKARMQALQRSNEELVNLYQKEASQREGDAHLKLRKQLMGTVLVRWKKKYPQTETKLTQRLRLFGQILQVHMLGLECKAVVYFDSPLSATAAAAQNFDKMKVTVPEKDFTRFFVSEPNDINNNDSTESPNLPCWDTAESTCPAGDICSQEDDIFGKLRNASAQAFAETSSTSLKSDENDIFASLRQT